DLVAQGADRDHAARRSCRAWHPARLGRRGRKGGAGGSRRDGALAPRGRGHSAHLRQCTPDSLRFYLPRGGAAKVLATWNAPAWRGLAAPVEIRLWPKEIGSDYLIARTGRERERAAAESLAEALGGLPLAHEQAAAYCEDLGIGLAEYRRRFAATTV